MHTSRLSLRALRTSGPGLVIAVLLLALVVGSGSAWAAGKIGASDIKKNAIRSKHIKNGAVHSRDIRAGAVTGAKVAAGSLTGAQVAADSLTGAQINESTLGQVPDSSKLAGRLPATFLNSTIYKTEAPTTTGTRLGDNTNVISFACNPGDILLSGGPASVAATSDLLESFPTPGSTNSWTARIYDNGVADSFTVVILCVDQ